jgi:hypothetical protein
LKTVTTSGVNEEPIGFHHTAGLGIARAIILFSRIAVDAGTTSSSAGITAKALAGQGVARCTAALVTRREEADCGSRLKVSSTMASFSATDQRRRQPQTRPYNQPLSASLSGG